MTMTRESQLEVLCYMANTSGEERTYFDPNGGVSKRSRVLRVPVAIVCEDDTYTEVEVFADGSVNITGWNDTDGLGDTADTYTDEEIEKLYNALFDMV